MPNEAQNNEPTAPAMAEIIASVIEDVAEAIEAELGIRAAISAQGGPYETSLLLAHEKKLKSAAASALATIIGHLLLRPAGVTEPEAEKPQELTVGQKRIAMGLPPLLKPRIIL